MKEVERLATENPEFAAIAQDVSFSCDLALSFLKGSFGEGEEISRLIADLESVAPFELMRTWHTRRDFFISNESEIVAVSSDRLASSLSQFADLKMSFENCVFSGEVSETDVFMALAASQAKIALFSFGTDEEPATLRRLGSIS